MFKEFCWGAHEGNKELLDLSGYLRVLGLDRLRAEVLVKMSSVESPIVPVVHGPNISVPSSP